jgi:Phage integrase family
MKLRPTQLGVRENTASPRQHAPRVVMNASVLDSDLLSSTERPGASTHKSVSPIKETFELSLTGPESGKEATGGEENGTIASARFENGQRPSVDGWHTFRHSYSTLLRALRVDLKVQQELLRHADIRTTMNIYTQAMPDAMRRANSRVVEMVLPERKAG